MSTEPQPPADIDNWKIPTIVEIESARDSTELSKTEFSEFLGYQHTSGYTNAISQSSMSYEKIRQSVLYLSERGIITYYAPSIDDIAGAIDRRGIPQTHFSEAIGYASSCSFGQVLTKGEISQLRYRATVEALEYYDRNGIIPLPYELDVLNI